MDNLTVNFINQIIYDTQNDKLFWSNLFHYTDAYDIEDLPGLKYLFFENEYRKVNLINSYICQTYHFILIAINETFYSGKEEDISTKTNIYLSKDGISSPELVEISNELKNQLIQAVSKSNEEFLNGEVAGYNEQSSFIMKAYLRDHETHEKSS